MPLLSQWIKKFDKSKLVEFFGRGGQKRYFGEFLYGLELVRKINAFRLKGEKLHQIPLHYSLLLITCQKSTRGLSEK